jgi:signal transduction histidine kinase
MMRDNRQSQNPTPPALPEDPDLIHLIRSLELANLELDRVHRWQREFIANTSHELRTPLNAILSFLRLVMDGLCDSPEEARQFVHSAYDSARSLLNLINEHLDSAEIEAGKLDLQLTEVNVAAVFEQVEKSFRRQADQKRVRLTFRAPRTRVLVRADAVNLSQVLLNLVANAIQSTTQGEVRVQARSWRDQGHVRFQVRSLGWSPEKQGNLFHKVDPTSSGE